MAEAGFPEVVGATWTAVVAPAGTPKDIVAKLNDLIVAGLAQPDIKAKLAAMAYVGIGNSPQECDAFFKDRKWRPGEGHKGRRPARRMKIRRRRRDRFCRATS